MYTDVDGIYGRRIAYAQMPAPVNFAHFSDYCAKTPGCIYLAITAVFHLLGGNFPPPEIKIPPPRRRRLENLFNINK